MHFNWDLFISHAHEDKESFVRPLVEALERRGIKVWFDETTPKVGASLRRSIEEGLSQSQFGLVVISKSFFEKEWPQRELDGLVSLEEVPGSRILPVWHNLTYEEVLLKAPMLSDRLALRSELGIEEVADRIAKRVSEESTSASMGVYAPDRSLQRIEIDNRTIQKLTRRLLSDYTEEGAHAGEFGRTASSIEQDSWVGDGPEEVAVKPWYYLTYWAVRGLRLAAPSSLKNISSQIEAGVSRRIGSRWVKVALDRSKTYDTMPGEQDKVLANSYRHTLRGANILLWINGSPRLPFQVMCDLLDPGMHIRNEDGGWPQCNMIFTASDLWTSAYFLRFTYEILEPALGIADKISDNLRSQIANERKATVEYMLRMWEQERWAYRGIPSVVTVPKLLAELAGIVDWGTASNVQTIIEHCLSQLTQSGRLKTEAELKNYDISELQQLARIGFALQELEKQCNSGLEKLVSHIRSNVAQLLESTPKIGPEDISFCLNILTI